MADNLARQPSEVRLPETLREFEERARHVLPKALFEYLSRAAGDGSTHRNNLRSFSDITLVSRALRGAETAASECSILGRSIAAPILIAPTAWHGLFSGEGEDATYAAAREFKTSFLVSSFSSRSFQDLARSSGFQQLEGVWYQLLIHKDFAVLADAFRKAEDYGCEAIVLTVDAPSGCAMCKAGSGISVGLPPSKLPLLPKFKGDESTTIDEYYRNNLSRSAATWDYVSKLCAATRLPVILKGIVHPEDARLAESCGAKGIVVSNHGGRQMAGGVATLCALQSIVAHRGRSRDSFEIYLDGGIRSGSDVFKALALGAKAVLVGRPVLHGLAAGGAAGVAAILSILKRELEECMATCGVSNVDGISTDLVHSSLDGGADGRESLCVL